jgi:hypothetical protein
MRKQTLMIFLVLLGLVSSVHGKILETARFHEVAHHITRETLIVMDIDDTIIVPAQMVGSDEWFYLRWKKHETDGMSKSVALEKALAEWESIRHVTKMKTVEKETPAFIKELQKKGHKLMGLTSQGLGLATRTVLQLKENSVDLSVTAPTLDDYYVNLSGHSVLFRKGILFTSGQNKGEAFFKFCDSLGLKLKKIVYIDDKESQLAALEKEAVKRGIEYIGLRYAYADIHKAAFRPEIADFQFFHSNFAKLLSDEEANAKLKLKESAIVSEPKNQTK